jgi:hypothetical protein
MITRRDGSKFKLISINENKKGPNSRAKWNRGVIGGDCSSSVAPLPENHAKYTSFLL